MRKLAEVGRRSICAAPPEPVLATGELDEDLVIQLVAPLEPELFTRHLAGAEQVPLLRDLRSGESVVGAAVTNTTVV